MNGVLKDTHLPEIRYGNHFKKDKEEGRLKNKKHRKHKRE